MDQTRNGLSWLSTVRPMVARSADGRVLGTYVHGLFASDVFRAHFLSGFRSGEIHLLAYEARIDATLDALADHVARHIRL